MKYFMTLVIATLLCPLFSLRAQGEYRIYNTQEYTQNFVVNQPKYYHNKRIIEKSYKEFLKNGEKEEFNVNLIFHNLYSSSQEMVPQSVIDRQIELLNTHFTSAKYPDPLISNYHEKFENRYCKNTGINFCLVTQQTLDSKGEPYMPVNYRQIVRNECSINNEMKNNISGHPVVLPDLLINIWIVNLEGLNAGFAQLPGGNPDHDGVVIDYQMLKDIDAPENVSIYNGGKTLTHLIANYLNVYELWNEKNPCSDDAVGDTPIHNAPNYRCYRSLHLTTCGKRLSVEMLNNFMDATPDACQYYFSNGQMMRMQSLLSPEGYRYGLTQTGCTKHLKEEAIASNRNVEKEKGFSIFPNPSNGNFNVEFYGLASSTSGNLSILDIKGNKLLEVRVPDTEEMININLSDNSSNLLYFVKFQTNQGETFIKKLIINQ